MKLLPQEVEVRFIIPTIRKEIARELNKQSLTQKEIARILEVTEPAVSQYLNDKRGINVNLSEKNKVLIKNSVSKILKTNECAYEEIYRISKKLIEDKSICEVHRMFDNKVPKGCEICLK